MARTAAQKNKTSNAPDPTEGMLRVRVTRRGADRISTGQHDPVEGDILFEAGEEFDVIASVAHDLVGEDPNDPSLSKDWVEIIRTAKQDPLDHDGDGKKGGFNNGDEMRRGPGRPPKVAE